MSTLLRTAALAATPPPQPNAACTTKAGRAWHRANILNAWNGPMGLR